MGLEDGVQCRLKISVPADFTIDEIRFVGAPVYGNCKIPYVITSHETTRTTAADSLYLSEENQTVAFKLLDYKAGDTVALTIDLWGEVINYIELTSVADKKVVATPSIYVEEGHVSDTITLTSDTENAIIYYTLDGTEPTTSSNRYTGRFMISGNCTIKAIATARVFNFEDSEVAEKVVDHFKTQGGFSFTFAPGDGTTVDLTGDPKYKYVRVSDLNPAFQIKGENTVYSDSRFKMAAGSEFAICVPANAIVTKLTFVNACDNYYNAETGANTDSEWDYIKSEGATVIVSDDMKITSAKNITASIQNHTAGTPILFRIKKSSAESPRKRILLLNGDYYMGQVQTAVKGYNISMIGQSKSGVRIYNDGLDGIKTSSTINNESEQLYMQDLTIENAESLRKGNFRGVHVAYSGGNKAILKNVELIGGQDTYVTGTRAYHEDCTIHGTVDFICGGGDNYFYHTDLLIGGDAVITAAGHEVSTEWGYVFRDCTVKPGTYAETTPDKSYSLGRP